ncbi:uncharacterized protein LOC111396492 [Olea europaea var. sylvestris]|uniref:uncharacterized protein LOC111396492 n=1 Tax=Olea europaea var. sylvestris TaxID=158386 RepID=UPI000C1D2539|nr:uncharacterized protein LOC111396492 [Olea europaea var. sylvestris]
MEYKNFRKMMSKFLAAQSTIILSLSVVSLIFSNSDCFFACLSSLKLYFSTYPFHLLGLALNKNCIFLICNGLVMFFAKTSGGSIHPSSGSDVNELVHKMIGDSLQPSLETKGPTLLIKDAMDVDCTDNEENEELEEENEAEASEEEEEEEVDERSYEDEKKLTNSVMEDSEGDGHGDEGGENESEIGLFFEEEEESMELLSTEELNKKFEDFILKMKEDVRMGSSTPTNIGQVHYNYDINLYDKNWPIITVN